MIADAGIQDRISFYVAPVHSWGNEAHKKSLSAEEFAKWEITWLAEMIQLGFSPGLIPPRKPVVCLAVMNTGELVDANGELFACTEVSYVPLYGKASEYSLGNLDGVESPENRGALAGFNEDVRAGEYPCSTCSMLPVCGGACPKLWKEGLAPCPSVKFNIGERLALTFAPSRFGTKAGSFVGPFSADTAS